MADKNDKQLFEVSQSDFEFVQSNEKIFDKALDTKPTTFAKDALKRFCKNKSSIVGAFILGILILMAIFVPVISPKNIDQVSITEKLLYPKLFKAGTGFWDGTKEITDIVYNMQAEAPAGYEYKPAILEINVDKEPTLINQANPYGFGGYVMFVNENQRQNVSLYSYPTLYTQDGNYSMEYALKNQDGVDGYQQAEYRVVFKYGTNLAQSVVLKDWSKDYTKNTINISEKLKEFGLDNVTGSISFENKAIDGEYTYLLIENCIFSANENVENYNTLTQISFTDATKMVLTSKFADATQNTLNVGYWTCNGRKGIFESKIYYCDFIYDKYEAVYGEEIVTYAKSEMDVWRKNGWCNYEDSDPVGTFEVLDAKECPISEIQSVIEHPIIPGSWTDASCVAYRYRKLGYYKMPIFLFGTNAQGQDLFKKAFTGLRTSLILGVLTAAFCFIFGLCWGSISGYFGGTTDLLMERFCELLSGIPWIVIMTLAILHLGNNAGTFLLALCMTGWLGTAARTRTQFYRFKGREYVLASRTLGSSDIRLIFKHILPNSMGTIITGSVLMITSVIFSEANIAYLNLGLQGVESFGVMMSENQQYLSTFPNLVLFPAVIISLMMISFNLFGNGLRDAFNPSLKGSE